MNKDIIAQIPGYHSYVVRRKIIPPSKRDRAIYKARTVGGEKLQVIGDRYGLSRERINQIVALVNKYLAQRGGDK